MTHNPADAWSKLGIRFLLQEWAKCLKYFLLFSDTEYGVRALLTH